MAFEVVERIFNNYSKKDTKEIKIINRCFLGSLFY